jgi:predicted amidohydrolase
MTKQVSVVGIQTSPTKANGNELNLKHALSLLDDALRSYSSIDAVVLPEDFYDMDTEDKSHFGAYPEEVREALSARAKYYGAYIIGGTVLHRKDDGKLYNTSLLFDREGKVVGDYDKIHLFDVLDGEGDNKESNYCTRGDHLLVHDTDFGRIGVIVCYDIRFPEFMRTLALQGVRYLFVPAAFYSPRQDHWTDLLRAIALQNSLYVVAVNNYGAYNADNIFCGRSLIADPWGIAIAQASDRPGFIQAYTDPAYPKEIADKIGSFHNRVPSVYDIPKEDA